MGTVDQVRRIVPLLAPTTSEGFEPVVFHERLLQGRRQTGLIEVRKLA
jgi:hypothetical protein